MKTERIIEDDGIIYNLENGNGHRQNGPAIIEVDGSESWMINGIYYRKNDPVIIAETRTISKKEINETLKKHYNVVLAPDLTNDK